MAKRAEAKAAGSDMKKGERKEDEEKQEIKEDEEEYKFDFEKEKEKEEPILCLSDVNFGSLANLLKAIEDVKPSEGADAGKEFNRFQATIAQPCMYECSLQVTNQWSRASAG
jgi:hypothetical protein